MARMTGIQHVAVAVNNMTSALKLCRDILGAEARSGRAVAVRGNGLPIQNDNPPRSRERHRDQNNSVQIGRRALR
jgi:hypothetical protein